MKKAKPSKNVDNTEKNNNMALTLTNYKLLLLSFTVIVVGFVLMSGGGSSDPANVFNYEMFSFRRITMAPIIVLGGFALGIYAIMKSSKKEE